MTDGEKLDKVLAGVSDIKGWILSHEVRHEQVTARLAEHHVTLYGGVSGPGLKAEIQTLVQSRQGTTVFMDRVLLPLVTSLVATGSVAFVAWLFWMYHSH